MSREFAVRSQYLVEFTKKAEDKKALYQFVQEHDQNVDLIVDINGCLESFAVSEVDELLYEGLFHLYQEGNQRYNHFVLQFLPSLISIYLSLIGRKRALGGGRLETLLLSIYNKEASSNAETPFVKSYKIPSLSNSSVYHEPASTASSTLTERALSRHEQSDKPVMMKVPTKVLNRITVSTRSDVIATVLDIYNRSICIMTEASHSSFCKMVLRIARSGFVNFDSDYDKLLNVLEKSELDAMKHYSRVKLSNAAYQQLIIGLYFIMHDGLACNAIVALENLIAMSKYQLNAALTMTLNALTDSIMRSQEETAANLSRDPHKSVRRVTDIAQRRYAVSLTNSLARQTPTIKDCVVPGRVDAEHNSELKTEAENQDAKLNHNDDAIDIKEGNDLSLPLDIRRPGKLSLESEDEAVNESTTLLDNSSCATSTENSSILCHHELVALNGPDCNDADPADIVIDEIHVKLVEERNHSDRLDTAL